MTSLPQSANGVVEPWPGSRLSFLTWAACIVLASVGLVAAWVAIVSIAARNSGPFGEIAIWFLGLASIVSILLSRVPRGFDTFTMKGGEPTRSDVRPWRTASLPVVVEGTPNWTQVREFLIAIESLGESERRSSRAVWRFENMPLYRAVWGTLLRGIAAFMVRGHRRAQAKGLAWARIRLLVQEGVVAASDCFPILNATFAIIDRDELSGPHFKSLYAPFQLVVPFESLERNH